MIDPQFGITSIFFLSILNQIILPAPIDIILIGMYKIGFTPILLILVTTLGMLIGSSCDYFIAKFGVETVPFLKKETHTRFYKKAERFYKKYGKWSLLITFFPFIGKYFPAVAGAMEESYGTYVLFYSMGKLIYFSLIYLFIFRGLGF